jgi:hypothetical protein
MISINEVYSRIWEKTKQANREAIFIKEDDTELLIELGKGVAMIVRAGDLRK